jgi:putative transposase
LTVGLLAMKTIAETLGVARSNFYDRLKGATHARGRYHKRGDAELLARITRLVSVRLTYRYRRITAVLKPRTERGSLAACKP